jgi:hypothetical protein
MCRMRLGEHSSNNKYVIAHIFCECKKIRGDGIRRNI